MSHDHCVFYLGNSSACNSSVSVKVGWMDGSDRDCGSGHVCANDDEHLSLSNSKSILKC